MNDSYERAGAPDAMSTQASDDRLKVDAREASNTALRQTIDKVLARLPAEARERFLRLKPHVVCLDGAVGMVTMLQCDHSIFSHSQPVICLTPSRAEQTPRGLHYLIGHEISHLVLGHLSEQHRRTEEEREAEVEAYLDSLGFERPRPAEEGDHHLRLRAASDWAQEALARLQGDLTEDTRQSVVGALQNVIELVEITLLVFEAKATRCPAPDVEVPPVAATLVNGQGLRQPVHPRPRSGSGSVVVITL